MQVYGPALFFDFRSGDMSTPETLRVRVGVGLGLGLARVRVSVTRGLARAARGSAVPADPPGYVYLVYMCTNKNVLHSF